VLVVANGVTLVCINPTDRKGMTLVSRLLSVSAGPKPTFFAVLRETLTAWADAEVVKGAADTASIRAIAESVILE